MPIENIAFNQTNILSVSHAPGEIEATPMPRQQRSDAKVGSPTPNLPDFIRSKAPARTAPAAPPAMLATPATPDTCEPASAPETREGARIKRNAHQDHPCAARESMDPMNLAIELQAELAATNMTLQAENQMHAAQVHNSRDLVQASKDAVKSFVEAGHKQ